MPSVMGQILDVKNLQDRSILRIHLANETELKTTYEKTMYSIKNYLGTVKLIKSNIRKHESDRNYQAEKNYNAKIQEEDERKNDTSEFLIADVERLIDSLL